MVEKIHLNKLDPVNPNDYEGPFWLCVEVERRFLDLTETYYRIKGVQLLPPKEMNKDILLWREMAVRFKKRDYRCTRGEILALRTVAQWTLDENCKLRNQPRKTLVWPD